MGLFQHALPNLLSYVCWCFCPQHREDSLPHLSCLLKTVGVGGSAGSESERL